MRLTVYTDFSLRVLMYLALHPERRPTIAEIASSYGISKNHLMKVVYELAVAEAKGNASPGNTASVLKNSATAIAQTRAELTLEIMGHQGLGWEGEAFTPEEVETVRGWLSGKAMSIYGGSFEIQNNIISKRILGLPEMTQAQ